MSEQKTTKATRVKLQSSKSAQDKVDADLDQPQLSPAKEMELFAKLLEESENGRAEPKSA